MCGLNYSSLKLNNQKMMIVFYLLLMITVGRCRVDQMVQRQTLGVGDDVTLTCDPESWERMVWIRLVSGNLPEVVGKTFSSESVYPRIRAAVEHRSFVLRIKEAKQSDSAVYYCMTGNKLTFLKGVELKVKGPGPDVTAAPPSPSAPVHPGNSAVTLQCSVLCDSENKMCGEEDHSVCCLGAGLDESNSIFTDFQRNRVEEHEDILEELSKKKCLYRFFKNISSTDNRTYYCAVATCGEIFCGNASKPNSEVSAVDQCDPEEENKTIVSLLCAALAISLIVVAFLMYSINKLKKKSCGCCNADGALQTNAATAGVDRQSQQADDDSLVYSAPTFTKRKSGKAERRGVKTEEEESIYTEVTFRALESD